MTRIKAVKTIAKANSAQVGDGFFIRRPMPSASVRLGDLSPFLMLDHAGPTHFEPSDTPKGVDVHPHRGFETVTIVYQGELEHRDSSGSSGKIGVGDVQWMTAGSGVVHEEKHSRAFTEAGGTLEMIQLWVNLPAKYKMTSPRYQELAKAEIPNVQLEQSNLRVIAGTFAGKTGPAKTFTPLQALDIRATKGDTLRLPLTDGHHTGLYVLSGQIQLGEESVHEAELAVLDLAGEEVVFDVSEDSRILLLSGEPINEPIASYGPFVMNRASEIQEAISDYRAGKMGHLSPA